MNSPIGFDTNVCLRLARFEAPFSDAIFALYRRLRDQNISVVCAEGTLREVYRIATGEVNGYDLGAEAGLRFLDRVQKDVLALPTDLTTLERWREILLNDKVRGRRVHDAHIAATLLSHGVTTIVTLDAKFRFSGLESVTPAELLTTFGAVSEKNREADPQQ